MERKTRKGHWGIILTIMCLNLFGACIKEPEIPSYDKGEQLNLDSAHLEFYNQKDSFLFNHPLKTGFSSNPLYLDTNATYHAILHCFSKGVELNTTITNNGNFYLFGNEINALEANNLSIITKDVDNQNLAIGLKTTWSSNAILSDSLLVSITGWYYSEAVKGIKAPTGTILEIKVPVVLK